MYELVKTRLSFPAVPGTKMKRTYREDIHKNVMQRPKPITFMFDYIEDQNWPVARREQ